MTTWRDRTLIEDVLVGGLDDWVYAGWLHQTARDLSGLTDRAQLRSLAIGVIAEVLVSGLMVAGEVSEDGHRPWDCSTEAALARIVEDWLAWGEEPPTPGAIVWLALTDAGRAIGEAVLSREQAS